MSRGARLLLTAAVAANLLPAGLLFYFIHRFGVDLPWRDEWEGFVVPLQQLDQGTLRISGLFAQFNEHRPFFPRLLTLANAALFHWNRTAEMYATAALLMVSAWLLFGFVRKYWDSPLTPLLFIPMAWTLLGWRQWENLLWGFQTCFGLLVAGAVAAFCQLHRTRGADRFVWGAAVAAFVASFSLAGGLFVWPVGLAQLVLQRRCGESGERPGVGAFAVWASAGVLSWVFFFSGFHETSVRWPTGPGYLMEHPLEAARFVLGMIAGPLSDGPSIAPLLGVMVTALCAWALFRMRRAAGEMMAAAPLIALLTFILLIALVSCDRRMGRGIGQALSSRYCSISALGLVALYALLARFALTEWRRPHIQSPAAAYWLLCGGFGVLLLVASLAKYTAWRQDPAGWRDAFARGTLAARYAGVMSDEAVSTLYPDPDVVRARAPFLKAHGYSLFHEAVPMGVPARYDGSFEGCAIEAVNGRTGPVIDVHRSGDRFGLRVTGWIGGQELSRLFVSIDGRIDVPALRARARPGGFTGYVRTALLAAGEHTLELKIVSEDGAGYGTCGAADLRVAE